MPDTQPNPKDPQADIREDILTIVYAHVDLPSPEHETEANIAISELVQLFQAHQQQLLRELLKYEQVYEKWVGEGQARGRAEVVTAVPVSVIQSKIGELNG